ncbi:MAG: 2Fe-2S iron-sulfur cluster-binding protein, partial [Candidatus Promineifilaceae bacterium]
MNEAPRYPRLAPQTAEVIDRTKTVSFTFNGRTITAYEGDTIASALTAANIQVISRSFKYHRPRGLLCCSGHCPNCLVQVDEEPNVRSCMRPVSADIQVKSQNAWPSLEHDVMSLTALGDRFLPVGFYYKTFIHPQALWPAYEHFLRHVAGLGVLNPDTPPGEYDKQYLHADVIVVGGGPAGISAAVSAAEQGARVMLFDDNPEMGGHIRFSHSELEKTELLDRLKQAAAEKDLRLFPNTTVLGWYEENWLSAVQGNRLYKIRGGSVIFATGAYEQPLVFDGNDLPGVMLGSGVQRLVRLYSVAPWRRTVIVTANDDGWRLAADLQAAGVRVAAIADQRLSANPNLVEPVVDAGAEVFWSHTILAADGKGKVERATIVPVDEHGQISSAAKQRFDCDLVAVSIGWTPANGLLYQANGRLGYDHERQEFMPASLPSGIFVAGRVAGTHSLSTEMMEGEYIGLQAAALLGLAEEPSLEQGETVAEQKSAETRRTSSLVRVPGKKKQFLCYCEDVTNKDLETAIAEGYNSIELLKRYSTISMGPCQGKMCSFNTIHLCARANDWTIEQTGTTTARPPMTPVSMGALAGQNMEPEQLTPVHDWHLSHGAKMMVAGTWIRPEHYGDPTAEVKAVRERVGLIDVSTLGKLKLTGPGVPDLLDKIYINKWQKLGIGRVRYGVMCNDEGVIMDDGVTAHVAENEWYTTTTSSGAGSMYEWIQWWVQSGWGDGVHLINMTEANAAFNLAGPQSRAVLEQVTDADVSNEAFPYMHVRLLDISGVSCRVMRIGFTGELSYEIHCPSGYGFYVWQALMAAGESFGILPFGVEAQRVLRLEKAHIIVGQDTDALTDPIMADMSWAVKLDKDNFLGQRPLSRAAQDGPKQKLVGFKMVDS